MNPYEKDLRIKINNHFQNFQTQLKTEKDKLNLLNRIRDYEADIINTINNNFDKSDFDVNNLYRFSCYQIAYNEFKKFYEEIFE